ncbi:hypothetical protein Tco_1141554 [Tanacetum coccineum]
MYITRCLSHETRFVFNLFIIFFTTITPRTSDKCPLVLVSWWFRTFSDKMIWVSASKTLSFTFGLLVVSASLECLFVIPRLYYEPTSSLEELLEVFNHHGIFFASLPEVKLSSSLDSFSAFKARDLLSPLPLTILESFLMINA